MEPIARAIQHLQSGDRLAAERICHEMLQADPKDAAACHLLGAMALQAGQVKPSVAWVQKAVEADGRNPAFLNTLGVAYSRDGRPEEALGAFHQAIELRPDFPEALNNLGNVLKGAGQSADAVACYQRALTARPDYPDALNNLGDALTIVGKLPEAVGALERAIQLRPHFPEAFHNLGRALQRSGRTADAIVRFRRAVELRSSYVEALNNLGSALQEIGDLGQATARFREAVALAPNHPEALNNLGNALHQSGELAEAAGYLERALLARPGFAEAHTNLGNVHRDWGRFEQARERYQTALALKPELAEAHNNLGNVLLYERKSSQAEKFYEAAVALKPDYADAHHNLGNARYEQGRVEDARQAFSQAIALKPDKVLWKLRRDAICPWVFQDFEEIDRYRGQLERTLDDLLEQSPKLSVREIFTSACEPAFALNYHGRSNLSTKQKYARLLSQAVPELQTRFGTGRPAVGFLVTRGHEGIFMRSMKGVINRLTQGKFRLLMIASISALPRIEREIAHSDVEFVGIPEQPEPAVEVVRNLRCDLLYHWEISSDVVNYLLALYRLAPIQCTSWGIQDTSGVPAVDLYLSSSLLETAGAQRLYSERLCLMGTLPTYQFRSARPAEPPDRSRYHLSEQDHVYLCAQNLLKFHPDFDHLLAGILRQDLQGKLVITQPKDQARVAEHLKARLAKSMPDAADRIIFLPRQQGDDYLNLVRTADVMLDPPHFCGVNTTYDGFAMGTPVVAFPTEFQRTRYTAACYQKMQIEGLVASTPEEYVQIALRLGIEPDYRQAMRRSIDERSTILFEEPRAVREYEEFFEQTIAQGRVNS